MDGPLRILDTGGLDLASFDRFWQKSGTSGTLKKHDFGHFLANFGEFWQVYDLYLQGSLWDPESGVQKVLISAPRIRPWIPAPRLK